MNSETLEEYKKDRLTFIKRFSEHLAKIVEYSHYESIMIESNRNEIWEVIANWSTLIKISPCIADELDFNGDQLEVGSYISLIFKTKRNLISNFRVATVSNKNSSHDWEYRVVLNDSTPKLPYQEIMFKIVFLSSRKCFLIFEHIYKEKLDIQMLKDVSEEKKRILQDIKNYLEK